MKKIDDAICYYCDKDIEDMEKDSIIIILEILVGNKI